MHIGRNTRLNRKTSTIFTNLKFYLHHSSNILYFWIDSFTYLSNAQTSTAIWFSYSILSNHLGVLQQFLFLNKYLNLCFVFNKLFFCIESIEFCCQFQNRKTSILRKIGLKHSSNNLKFFNEKNINNWHRWQSQIKPTQKSNWIHSKMKHIVWQAHFRQNSLFVWWQVIRTATESEPITKKVFEFSR
jgi:hypothetical protein